MLDSVTIDTTNVNIQGFFGDNLRNYIPMKCGGSDTQMTWIEGHYVEVRCKLSGRHRIGDEDCKASGGDAAYVYWVTGQYDVNFIKQEPCADLAGDNGNVGVITGGNTAPGGNNNDGDDGDVDDNTDESDDSIKVGIVPNKELADTDPEFCDEIDARHSTEPFKTKLEELNQQSKFDQLQEEGFVEYDNIPALIPAIQDPNDPSAVYYPMLDGIKGGTHLHTDIGFDSNSNNGRSPTYKVFSRKDLAEFSKLLTHRAVAGYDVKEGYDKVVSSEGIYTMRYSGSNTEIPNLSSLIDDTDLDEDGISDMRYEYMLYQEGYGSVEGLLRFLKDQNIPNMDKLELYKTDRQSLNTVKIEIGSDNKLKETSC